MATDSLYLALTENELEDVNRLELKAEWERRWSKDSTLGITAEQSQISTPSDKHKT